MRKLFIGLVGATALSAASAASATITIVAPTTVNVQGPVTLNSIDVTFGVTDTDAVSPFVETVSWMNDLAGVYNLRLFTNTDTANGPGDVDFSSAYLTGGGILNPINLLADPGNTDLAETLRLNGLGLAAGTYTLTIEGTRGSDSIFGGHIDFSAVPEPGTWAMMLLGFGAIGWQLRRRRSSQVLAQAV
jgi:hypothetical protein